MSEGNLRRNIMRDCPEEFQDSLKDFIDDVERLSNEILNKLAINDIADISDIQDAYSLTSELCKLLY